MFAPGAPNGLFSAPLLKGFGLTNKFTDQVYRGIIGLPAFSLVPVLLQPKSRGKLSLKSKNPFEKPIIQPNFFSHPEDLDILVKGAKLVRIFIHQK